MALVAYGSSGESSENESEDENVTENVEIQSNDVVREKICVLSKVKKPGSNPVRNKIKSELLKIIPMQLRHDSGKSISSIAVPSLSSFDEDTSEDEPKKKRLKSNTMSGLFSMLPAPKNSISGSKEMNRPLIPHSITKNKTQSLSAQKLSEVMKNENKNPNIEGVNKTEHVDFFSLSNDDQDTSEVTAPETRLNESCSSTTTSSFVHPAAEYNHAHISNTSTYNNITNINEGDINADYGYIENTVSNNSTIGSNLSSNNEPSASENAPTNPYEDEQFLKLMGKKKGETIEFIDISEADQRAAREEWETKTLSEEKPTHSAKRNPNQPNSQQKRKHQITYLAHQARQRELELKNTWAQNRMTRKQTQAKYGF